MHKLTFNEFKMYFPFIFQEKRKRQMAIEDKRRQLEDLILQLQHLKVRAESSFQDQLQQQVKHSVIDRWLVSRTPSTNLGPLNVNFGKVVHD